MRRLIVGVVMAMLAVGVVCGGGQRWQHGGHPDVQAQRVEHSRAMS